VADSSVVQLVNQWTAHLTTITSNLMDLYQAESTKIIRARLKDPVTGFSGVTREKATGAIETLDRLLEQYELLAHVVEEASDLAKKNGIFHSYDARINDLLNGPSVAVTQGPVALQDRGLLDNEQRVSRLTPAAMLAQMEHSFAQSRDALSAITSAVAGVQPRLAALKDKTTMLDSWAGALKVASTTAIPDVSQALSDVERDPMGSAVDIRRLEETVARRRDELQAIDAEQKEVLAELARAKTALLSLQDVIARSAAAFAEARQTIAPAEELAQPLADTSTSSLAEWLRTLEQNIADGRFAAVKVGMVKWERECNDKLNAARAGNDHNRALLNERAELQGRFKAVSAKADALRSRGVVFGDAVDAASRQARGMLDAIPFDIRTGRRLVEAFEAAVAAASRP
jgi:chromosome segregation ATPase